MRSNRWWRGVAWVLVASAGASACVPGTAAEEHSEGAASAIVFGADDRVEYTAISDARIRDWAGATAGLFLASAVACEGEACTLGTRPLEERIGTLCEAQPLKGQREGAYCTAFLIAPDLMLTAGHCMDEACMAGAFPPLETRVVFGFTNDANGAAPENVPADDVYRCSSVVGRAYSGNGEGDLDWTVFRLDRPVAGRTPLAMAPLGTVVRDDADLTVLGHPEGVPLKAAPNGRVTTNDPQPRFYANLDHLPGNSGSPVLDVRSGTVVGVLVTTPSETPFVSNGECNVERSCDPELGCDGAIPSERWAGVLRIGAAIGCQDGEQNGLETDRDCGGTDCTDCPPGASCVLGSDCVSGICEGGICAAPVCENGQRNDGETDVDCGGTCPLPCAVGQSCAEPWDCLSNSCADGTCQEPSCSDGRFNGSESDIDCGGSCDPCANGKLCYSGLDCRSRVCDEYATCVDPTCPNGVKDGTETGVDCGGTCFACALGEACRVASDCASGACKRRVCVDPLCFDRRKNGAESDRDCGGSCEPCATGKTCRSSSDCASGSCRFGRCAPERAPHCR